MTTYCFHIEIYGCGNNINEAWENALAKTRDSAGRAPRCQLSQTEYELFREGVFEMGEATLFEMKGTE